MESARRLARIFSRFEKKDQPEVALILDDILGSLKSGSRVNTLSARFRHYNIKLLLFSTQVFRYVSNIVRQNTTNLIVGSPFPNRRELNKIAEEFGDVFGGPNQFLKVYALCTPNRYDFMHCDLQANPPLASPLSRCPTLSFALYIAFPFH